MAEPSQATEQAEPRYVHNDTAARHIENIKGPWRLGQYADEFFESEKAIHAAFDALAGVARPEAIPALLAAAQKANQRHWHPGVDCDECDGLKAALAAIGALPAEESANA